MSSNEAEVLSQLSQRRHAAFPELNFVYVDVDQLVRRESAEMHMLGSSDALVKRAAPNIVVTSAIQLDAEITRDVEDDQLIERLHKTEHGLITHLLSQRADKTSPVIVKMPHDGWCVSPPCRGIACWVSYVQLEIGTEILHNTAESGPKVAGEVYRVDESQYEPRAFVNNVMRLVRARRQNTVVRQKPAADKIHIADYSINVTARSGGSAENYADQLLEAESLANRMTPTPGFVGNYDWRCVVNRHTHIADWFASNFRLPARTDYDTEAINLLVDNLREVCYTSPYEDQQVLQHMLSADSYERHFDAEEITHAVAADADPLVIANLLLKVEIVWDNLNTKKRSAFNWELSVDDKGVRYYTALLLIDKNL